MTDFQVYVIASGIVCVFALYRVTAIAMLAVSRAIPGREFKDL